MSWNRRLAFVAFAAACLLVAGSYLGWALMRDDAGAPDGAPATRGGVVPTGGVVLFQQLERGPSYASVSWVPAEDRDAERIRTDLVCERVHVAAGRGLCLMLNTQQTGYVAKVFGSDLEPVQEVPLTGIPSRARVSPDGRYGATTVFLLGHSYAQSSFSTRTSIIDMATGQDLGSLDGFVTTGVDGEVIDAPDMNYWGVTFGQDSDVFYATVETGGQTYLIEGNVQTREAHVLRDNVECPSLSPDGTRIAYKEKASSGAWRFHVLELDTMTDLPLAEERSIDDQVEWLDNERVLYGVDADIWVVPADGTGHPQRFLRDALSPAVLR